MRELVFRLGAAQSGSDRASGRDDPSAGSGVDHSGGRTRGFVGDPGTG